MKTIKKLDTRALQAALKTLPGWSIRKGKLHCEYVFNDFVNAFSFMTHMAMVAEQKQHHPEWSNVYKRVTIDLVTHEAEGITTRDVDMARDMERATLQS